MVSISLSDNDFNMLLLHHAGPSNGLWLRTLSRVSRKCEAKDRSQYPRVAGRETKETLLSLDSSHSERLMYWSVSIFA